MRENTVLKAPVTKANTPRSKSAIKTNINEYSTKPWPLSSIAINMVLTSFLVNFGPSYDAPEALYRSHRTIPFYT
jgi:hypothetical protein